MSLIGQAAGQAMLAKLARRKPRGRKLNKRQKREVKQLIGRNLEKKYIQGYQASTGIVYTGSIYNMNVPAQGDSDISRTGDRIKVQSIELRYECLGYDNTNKMRVIVLKWMEDNNSIAPAVNTVLDPTYLGTAEAPLSPYHWNNSKQRDFHIVYDKLHSLDSAGAGVGSGHTSLTRTVKLYGKKLGSPYINFNAGAVVTGEGVYYLIVLSDSAVAGHPKFAFYSRMTFTDG